MTTTPDPGSLRCGDADRERVAEHLATAYADGRLDQAEHAERLEAAWAARTFGELAPLTADLGPAPAVPGMPNGRELVDTRQQNPLPDRVTAVMSSTRRSGHWRLRRRTRTLTVMGEVLLDLREAVLEAPECHIHLPTVMGSVVIRVPEGIQVENRTTAIMAEVTVRGLGVPSAGAGRLILTGAVVMGEVKVLGPHHVTLAERMLGR